MVETDWTTTSTAIREMQHQLEIMVSNARADTAQDMLKWTRITTIAIACQVVVAAVAIWTSCRQHRDTKALISAERKAAEARALRILDKIESQMGGMRTRIHNCDTSGEKIAETDATLKILDLLSSKILDGPLGVDQVDKVLAYRKDITLSVSEWTNSPRELRAYDIADRLGDAVDRFQAETPTANAASEPRDQ